SDADNHAAATTDHPNRPSRPQRHTVATRNARSAATPGTGAPPQPPGRRPTPPPPPDTVARPPAAPQASPAPSAIDNDQGRTHQPDTATTAGTAKVSRTYRNDCQAGTGTASQNCQPATGTRWSSMNRNPTWPNGSCQVPPPA